MTDVLQVDFELNNQHAVLNLYSKFTTVFGDSGNGKSELIYTCKQEIEAGNCHVTCSAGYDVYLISQDDTNFNFDQITTRCVFVVDEISMHKTLNIKKMHTSNHIFVCITRASTLCGQNPLKGSYTLNRKDGWFEFIQATLPLYEDGNDIDMFVTEAREDRSEHQLLSVYTDKLVAARGRDKVHKKLFNTSESILVMMDLGNISNCYNLIIKRCRANPRIRFYDYLAFEELLFNSPLVSELPEKSVPTRFDSPSLESYYEYILTERTRFTEFQYVHGAPLASPFLDKGNFERIFNSDVGRPLLHLLQRLTADSADFDVQEYLHQVIGNKADFLPKAAVDECKTKEDCDNLIESLRHIL